MLSMHHNFIIYGSSDSSVLFALRPQFVEVLQREFSATSLNFLRRRIFQLAFSSPFPFSKGGKGKVAYIGSDEISHAPCFTSLIRL